MDVILALIFYEMVCSSAKCECQLVKTRVYRDLEIRRICHVEALIAALKIFRMRNPEISVTGSELKFVVGS